jgi:CspA family cold shock protein
LALLQTTNGVQPNGGALGELRGKKQREERYRKRIIRMPTGTVKWFNPAKGYGFIEPDDGGKDAFVHISAVERAGLNSLNEGQKISFEVQQGQNGKSSAENLTIIE